MVLYQKGSEYLDDICINGICKYSGKTIDQALIDNPKLEYTHYEIAAMEISDVEDNLYLNPWVEVDENRFNDMLECLPPVKWERSASGQMFRMSEFYTSNITTHLAEVNGRYFEAKRRTAQSYKDNFIEIQQQFRPYN